MEGRIQRIFLLARAAAASLGRSRPPCARAQADTPEYTAVYSSFGGLYNRPDAFTPGNAAVDVTHASRTLLWLKPSAANGGTDIVVMYDRATTVHAGKFKRCAVVAGEGWLRQRRARLSWLVSHEECMDRCLRVALAFLLGFIAPVAQPRFHLRWNMNWVTMPTTSGNVLTASTGMSRVQVRTSSEPPRLQSGRAAGDLAC